MQPLCKQYNYMKMSNLCNESTEFDRIVIKQKSKDHTGVDRMNLSRYVIGMVLNGEKYILQDDKILRVKRGEIFFLGYGHHLIEDCPSETAPYEQIAFYYTSDQLIRALTTFDEISMILTKKRISESKRCGVNVVVGEIPRIIRNFFTAANVHYDCRGFMDDRVCEVLKLTELVHLIIKYDRGDLLNSILVSLDVDRARFEHVIYSNIFEVRTVADLAVETLRSPTTFKKDFQSYFRLSPHLWFQRQRLNYACLLLCTTNCTIAQIGEVCKFPNSSHFIKLFKRYFGSTPSNYRLNNSEQQMADGGERCSEENNGGCESCKGSEGCKEGDGVEGSDGCTGGEVGEVQLLSMHDVYFRKRKI